MNQESLDVDHTKCTSCVVGDSYLNRPLCEDCENYNHWKPNKLYLRRQAAWRKDQESKAEQEKKELTNEVEYNIRSNKLNLTNREKSREIRLLNILAAKHNYHLLKIDPELTFKDDDA